MRTGLPYLILSDAALAAIERYGVRHAGEPEGRNIAGPSLFILDRAGVGRFVDIGEHPRDRPALGAIQLALQSVN